MNYRRRIALNQRRRRNEETATQAAMITPRAEAILAEYGYREIPEGLVGSGQNGRIIKADAVDWVVRYGSPPASSDEEE